MAGILNPRDIQLQSETRTQSVVFPSDYSFNASQINSGLLPDARIANSSITVSKLNITNLSAITSNLGTVNAGSITGSADINITGQAKFRGVVSSGGFTYACTVNESLNSQRGLRVFASTTVGAAAILAESPAQNGNAVLGQSSGNGGNGVFGFASGPSGVGVKAQSTGSGPAIQCIGDLTQTTGDSTLKNTTIQGTLSITSTTLVTNLNAQRWNGATNSSVTTGGATATFNGANKPGSNSSNSWWPVVINGTTRYIPAWT